MSDNQGNSETVSSVLSERGGFTIYQRNLNGDMTQVQAVKNGFSWPAFIFGPFWAWFSGMAGVGFGLLFCGIFASFFANIIGAAFLANHPIIRLLFHFLFMEGVAIWIGSSGNNWKKSFLEKKGYKKTGIRIGYMQSDIMKLLGPPSKQDCDRYEYRGGRGDDSVYFHFKDGKLVKVRKH